MVLQEIPGICWHWADSEMRIVPEGKIIIAVIVSNSSKIIVVGNTHEKKQKAKKAHYKIGNMFFL
jgi:hypothetical protein